MRVMKALAGWAMSVVCIAVFAVAAPAVAADSVLEKFAVGFDDFFSGVGPKKRGVDFHQHSDARVFGGLEVVE